MIVYKEKSRLKAKNRFLQEESKMQPVPLTGLKIKKDKYFKKFGITDSTIDKFHIGFCDDMAKPMAMRAFAPVLDDGGEMIIGVTGRTIFEKCDLCQLYHSAENGCPSDGLNTNSYSKWKHFGFRSGSILYNFSNAKKYIKDSGLVVLVEGPKDLWWLDQHGVHNVVALLRKEILDIQIKKLLHCGTMRVILCLDNDKAAIEIRSKIIENLSRFFRVIDLCESFKDIKDIAMVSSEQMNKEIVPSIKKWEIAVCQDH